MEQEQRFASMGEVGRQLGVTSTAVRMYERAGIIPAGRRVIGSQARIWPLEELDVMQARIAERRAARKGDLQPTGA
jgi:DNA-binding transcriptional MerR regulator